MSRFAHFEKDMAMAWHDFKTVSEITEEYRCVICHTEHSERRTTYSWREGVEGILKTKTYSDIGCRLNKRLGVCAWHWKEITGIYERNITNRSLVDYGQQYVAVSCSHYNFPTIWWQGRLGDHPPDWRGKGCRVVATEHIQKCIRQRRIRPFVIQVLTNIRRDEIRKMRQEQCREFNQKRQLRRIKECQQQFKKVRKAIQKNDLPVLLSLAKELGPARTSAT